MNYIIRLHIFLIIIVLRLNSLLANDSIVFIQKLTQTIITQDSSAINGLILSSSDYLDLAGLIGDKVDNDDLLDWENNIKGITESFLDGFNEIQILSRRLGKLDYYSHNLTPNFQTETNKNEDTIYLTKIYELELIFEKGISFYKFSTEVINIDKSFYLTDELRWKEGVSISNQNILENTTQNPYILFSYNYGQILYDSRDDIIYLNNKENPDYFISKLKLTKQEKKEIFSKLASMDF